MSTQITLSDALVGKGRDWAAVAWNSLPPRTKGINWDTLAHAALPLVNESSGKYHVAFNRSLGSDSSAFHETTRRTLWYNPGPAPSGRFDHDHAYSDSTRDHRLNVTSLMLAENIAFNENELLISTSCLLPLPPRNTKNLAHWMGLPANRNWRWSHEWDNIKPSFDQDRSPEASVRWSIEAAWRNLFEGYWINDIRKERGEKEVPLLRWENTAICALDAVYASMRYLNQAREPEMIRTIAEKLHKHMITYELWGDDTYNLDRANPNKSPKRFNEVSKEMQENYILIVLATLSGISDHMKVIASRTTT